MSVPFKRASIPIVCVVLVLMSLLFSACSSAAQGTIAPTLPAPTLSAPTVSASSTPDWFRIPMTDVTTGKTFTINDFAGKVILLETMAEWCPNCRAQENEVLHARQQLGNPSDLVSISLDVDFHEDAPSLQAYAKQYSYDWHFAIAPLEVMRALGNLYSAEYLNPPLAPMLIIDRQGKVYGLPYGIKSAESLKNTIAPYLAQ
jgi:thiol-disulfide isomerase/thioredoxin